MVVRRRKKSRKLRGRSRTMGWGQIGQHRKNGARGGFGNAGMHKHMWTWVTAKSPGYFGKFGFKLPPEAKVEFVEINVDALDDLARKLNTTTLDLAAMGYNKLLGRGKVKGAYTVIVANASPSAIKKVVEAGGKVITPDGEELKVEE
ncbi:50S ribosomal protein L15 [Ignicoccus islandicus DSM 13165]|uniref:Large ribosomal subunit protein uL15 n=1 Tax=Ignicoccus islandicus DSM 13165 TaxID=940295 RepID=A0A0U3DVN8_9CREN|nr:uL15 family ribosomal protein [Ignicoccus islandicus]ALU11498.1 50S ribosomal protein L15 [Ignicoccus islandicus DSM 13165]